jgi:hypothetical protein
MQLTSIFNEFKRGREGLSQKLSKPLKFFNSYFQASLLKFFNKSNLPILMKEYQYLVVPASE